MDEYTVSFAAVGSADIDLVGGKGANLGELVRAGFNVPPGFCVTTDAYRRFVSRVVEQIDAHLEGIDAGDLDRLHEAGSTVRALLEELPMPSDVEASVIAAWRGLGEDRGYAVRSSATAEDLPYASFAGQQDTFLNVRGQNELIGNVKACWISLFTDRAILYRAQRGIGHRAVSLGVVVQEMVASDVSGILFTADPVTGNRRIVSIDAGFGLGEALVSGIVTADLYKVDKRSLEIVERRVAPKHIAIRILAEGGTERVELPPQDQTRPALNDRWVRTLAKVGVQIESHFGTPQDVEWAIADDTLYIVQSRPITTLFPLPEPPPGDDGLHVYVSLSHFEVMTDAMPPLSISVLRTVLPLDHPEGQLESRTVAHAGGRLYGDVTPVLRNRLGRKGLPKAMAMADQRMAMALDELAHRPEVRQGRPIRFSQLLTKALPYFTKAVGILLWGRSEGVVEATLELIDTTVSGARGRLAVAPTLRDRLQATVDEMRHAFEPVFGWLPNLMAGALASRLIGVILGSSADPKDIIASERGLHGNVATEMNLAVGDLADAARTTPGLAELLARTDLDADQRLVEAAHVPGGTDFFAAWRAFLDRYGARGPSEIDLSRPRWEEDPSSLLQMVVNAMQHKEPGEHRRHFERLAREREHATERLIRAAARGWFGWLRRPMVRRVLRVKQNLTPMREHHKYYIIRLVALVKQVLVEAGSDLANHGRIDASDDVWFLTLPELLAEFGLVAGTGTDARTIVRERRDAFAHYQTLTPPRVMTSDGEIPMPRLDVDAPPGALIGTAASAGVVKGPARVVLDPSAEALKPGEILVAPFTDPGWTPLFVNAAGLVTEVGGLMTHGSVVAREYGIPAVVGVEDATTKIKTGQQIRVDGDIGYVEVLDHEPTNTSP